MQYYVIVVTHLEANATKAYAHHEFFTTEESALDILQRMASYWASQHGAAYKAFDAEQDGYVCSNAEITRIYRVQPVVDHASANVADGIVTLNV